MNGKRYSRLLAWLLSLVMVLSMLPANLVVAAETPNAIVIAGSDYQTYGTDSALSEQVKNLATSLKSNAGITNPDGFLFGGDYTVSTTSQTESANGISALKSAVKGVYSSLNDDDMLFIQGNHDPAGSSGLTTTGAHDADEYGVYVINEDDYAWYGGTESAVKTVASNLTTYLNEKIQAGYTKPIFLMTHLPLAFSMRCYNDGDGRYAKYIFDALNAGAEQGLNIIFMHGHDHSQSWDAYLGGSSIFLKKGDKINIANPSDSTHHTYTEETLKFTYMNYGYAGYYSRGNSSMTEDDTLTMTGFKIYDDKVEIYRVDANGTHNLKSAGVLNSYKSEANYVSYSANTTVYSTSQTVALNQTITPGEIVDPTDPEAEKVTIKVGETVTKTMNGSASLTTNPDTDIAVVEATTTESTGYSIASSIVSGNEYIIGTTKSGTTYYLKVDTTKDSNLGVTQDISEATPWTITASGSSYTITYEGTNGGTAYKYLKVGTISGSTVGLRWAPASDETNLTWTYSSGKFTTTRSSSIYNLRYSESNQSWQASTSSSADSIDLYEGGSATTTVKITGVKAGKTTAKVGDTTYEITVTEDTSAEVKQLFVRAANASTNRVDGTIELKVGETATVYLTYYSSNSTATRTFEMASADTTVATVSPASLSAVTVDKTATEEYTGSTDNQSFTIKAVKAGQTTIDITYPAGENTATVTVKVTDGDTPTDPVDPPAVENPDPITESISLEIGEAVTKTLVNEQEVTSNIDSSVATASAVFTEGISGAVASSIESGKPYILGTTKNGKTYYIKVDTTQTNNLTATTDINEATPWTITASGSSYTITYEGTNGGTAYKYLKVGTISGSTVGLRWAPAADTTNLTWTYSDGKFTTTRSNNTYKLRYSESNAAWEASTSNTADTIGLYDAETIKYTTVTITGAKAGTTTIVVGYATYNVTVKGAVETTTVTYKLVSSVTEGNEYLIVAGGKSLTNTNGNLGTADITGTAGADTITTEGKDTLWTIVANEDSSKVSNGAYNIKNNGYYLTRSSTSLTTATALSSYYQAWSYDATDNAITQQGSSGYAYAVDYSNTFIATEYGKAGTDPAKAYLYEVDNSGSETPHTHALVKTAAKAATCTEAGNQEYYTCGDCGKVYRDSEATEETTVAAMTLAATGHTVVTDAAVAATCTEAGKTAGSHCSVCNEVLVAQEEIAALGHNYEEVAGTAVEATCTTAGKAADQKCSRCGDVITGATIAAKGHTEVADAAIAATCSETGKTEGSHCSVCDTVLKAQEEIAALGHTEVVDAAIAATCTEAGKTEGKHCSVCKEVLKAQVEIAALGHDYEEVAGTAVAATCTEAGKEADKKCSRCDDVTTGATIAAKGHTEVVDVAVEATCTEAGKTKGSHCSVCDTVLKAQEEIAALGHTEVVDAAVAATCTEAGKTEGKHCSVCKEVLKAQEEIAALGHTEVVDAAIAATCTEAGKTEGKHCSVCNEVIKAQEEIATLGHDYEEVAGTAVAATCTEAGKEADKKCSRCDDVITGTTIAALGHTEVVDAAIAATCTEAGKTEGKHCSVCDEVLKAQEKVAALGHTEVTDAAVEATCTKAGKTEGSHCSVCDEVIKAQEEIEALGHAYEEIADSAVAATCTEVGKKADKKCSRCDDVTTGAEIKALGHDYEEVDGSVVEATCTKAGKKADKKCSRCDDVKNGAEIAAKGHTEVTDKAVEATCTEAGKTEGSHCSVCGEVLSGTEIKATGHTYDAGKITTAATTSATGVKTYTCTVCGATKKETIAKLDVLTPDQAPTSNPISQDKTGFVGKDISAIDKKITSRSSDEVSGAVYQLLRLRWKKIGSTYLTVQWQKMTGATSYVVYGAKCYGKFKKLATVKTNTYTQKKLKKGTYYKYFVVALKGKTVMATSKTIHIATNGGKVGNDKYVVLNKKDVTLKVGKSVTLKATLIPYSKKLRVSRHRGVRYESSNPGVATVTSKTGTIKAKKKGTCYVYAYAQNGNYKRIKVTVK